MIPSPGMAECYHFLISHIYENFIKFAYCWESNVSVMTIVTITLER
jgi:hypothetical protein